MTDGIGRGAWRGIIVGLILLALWTLRPFGVDAPSSLDTPFDTDRAIARLATILGDERPHPTDSDANDLVEARLLAEIRKAGFSPQVDERFHCNDFREGAAICARPRNIAFWVTPPGDDALLILSHHDSVAAGPGAADDGLGMAVALEIAYQFKGKKLARPVLVVITDAEEAGLVGAAAFAAHDPLANRVGAVINMEARGTTGGVNMFQTSTPNARDFAAIGRPLPSANSLATDFYELLPNDTDLTMLLPLKIDAGNYSIIGSGKRYHTPLDNLAHLDRNSVRHMGATTLSAVERFAGETGKGAEGQRVFTDVGRQFMLELPQLLAAVVIGMGLVAAAFLYWRGGAARRIRSAFIPLLAIVGGTGLAIGAAMLVGVLRPEADFGTAYPVVFRLLYAAAGLAGATAILALAREDNPVRGTVAAWGWLAILILAAFAIVPGLTILAAWSMPFVVAAAIAAMIPAAQRAVPFLLTGAAIVHVVIVLPLGGGIEEGLFVEQAAPATFLLVFMFLFFLPAAGRGTRWTPAVFGIVALGAFIAALIVPAYSPHAPRHLTVVHEDDNGKAAFLIADNGPVPAAMAAEAKFAATPDDKGVWRAPAPTLVDDGSVEILSDTVAGNRRTISLALMAPTANTQDLQIKDGKDIRNVIINGTRPAIKGEPVYIGCTGRTCRRLEVQFDLSAKGKQPRIDWRRTRFGAGEAGAKLAAKRPATAQPVHGGDRQVWIRKLRLPAAPTG
ncbi:MAG: M28 family peptidase [Sphingopyxis sp.]|nr:M28 family peptidase [Sphingopyxis sp.]